MRKLSLLLMIMALSSCAINNPLDLYQEELEKPTAVKTRAGDAGMQIDALRALSMLQTNHNVILFNSLSVVDGKYVLGLSLESALELGIPEELYMDFKESMDSLNE